MRLEINQKWTFSFGETDTDFLLTFTKIIIRLHCFCSILTRWYFNRITSRTDVFFALMSSRVYVSEDRRAATSRLDGPHSASRHIRLFSMGSTEMCIVSLSCCTVDARGNGVIRFLMTSAIDLIARAWKTQYVVRSVIRVGRTVSRRLPTTTGTGRKAVIAYDAGIVVQTNATRGFRAAYFTYTRWAVTATICRYDVVRTTAGEKYDTVHVRDAVTRIRRVVTITRTTRCVIIDCDDRISHGWAFLVNTRRSRRKNVSSAQS